MNWDMGAEGELWVWDLKKKTGRGEWFNLAAGEISAGLYFTRMPFGRASSLVATASSGNTRSVAALDYVGSFL